MPTWSQGVRRIASHPRAWDHAVIAAAHPRRRPNSTGATCMNLTRCGLRWHPPSSPLPRTRHHLWRSQRGHPAAAAVYGTWKGALGFKEVGSCLAEKVRFFFFPISLNVQLKNAYVGSVVWSKAYAYVGSVLCSKLDQATMVKHDVRCVAARPYLRASHGPAENCSDKKRLCFVIVDAFFF